jgi:hypothetical protein
MLLAGHIAYGQQNSSPDRATAAPKTKLEAFERQTGSVIIRGFTALGSVMGTYGGRASVEAREFANATTGKREYGIVVEVKEAGRLERADRAYIDYEEIEPLLHGIEYVLKVDNSATKLANFQADYHTKGDLTISTFSSGSGIKAAVTVGRIGTVDVIISTADLQAFRDLVAAAKTKLDGLRSPAG